MNWSQAFVALRNNRMEAATMLRTSGCEHYETKVRAKKISGGSFQYVQQCQHCGDRVGVALSQAKWHAENGRELPAAFDEQLRKNFLDEQQAISFEAQRGTYDRKFWDLYNQYLRSEEWAEKRRLVLEREDGRCQGCKQRGASQVHHLTYEHIGAELLFELVAICHACHEQAHGEKAA